jgi:hypothetical protein
VEELARVFNREDTACVIMEDQEYLVFTDLGKYRMPTSHLACRRKRMLKEATRGMCSFSEIDI